MTATSVTPFIIDALFAQATAALPDVKVYDGFGLTDDPGPDILMIGVDDGQSSSAATSADSSQTMATAGTPRSRSQTGSINCWALSWTGNAEPKDARDAVYAIQAAVEDILRADPTLGLAQPNGQVFVIQIGDERLMQDQTNTGAEALLTFTVNFEARI